MKGWAELKEAFWAALEGDRSERARHEATLAAIDPTLPARLDALLEADAKGEALEPIFRPQLSAQERPRHIGPYEVIGLLGAGGMGEVYRARDARLQREVAVKVLPSTLATDRERLARFEREAQVLASLNHPHIAQVYGLEETGGAPALVMELVEGQTLAELIAQYPQARLPLVRVFAIARQIADGLSAAHERDIVHRDLKPGNVALTVNGDVKILDFGIAKSRASLTPSTAGEASGTAAGTLLGTPAYMSPEQARGLAIDRRTDIWAFGCVLYELLTGRGPFSAATPSDSLAAVLERRPDLTLLPPETPPAVRSLLGHCLEKDPRRRLRDIADARPALEEAPHPLADERDRPGDSGDRLTTGDGAIRRRAWTLAGLVVMAVGGAVAGWLWHGAARLADTRRTVSSLVLPGGMRLSGSDALARFAESRFAISADSRRLVLVASDQSGATRLWLRDLGSAVFQPLAETEGASYPFWSPDSESIGFIAAERLKTIKVYGGGPVTISDTAFRTGSWSRDGLILFAPASRSPLFSVPASGGTPMQVTTLDSANGEVQHSDPVFLPDGRHFLYVSFGSVTGGALDPRGIFVGSLDGSTPPRLIVAGSTQARYASGHLLFVQRGTLMAQRFDARRFEVDGAPFSLVEDIKLSTAGATGATAGYSVSDRVLAYQSALRTESRPVWFDRSGIQGPTVAGPADYGDVALSPDGARVVVSVADSARATRDLWLYQADGSAGQRLTADPGDEFAPVWSPDGVRLLFSAMTAGLVELHIKDLTRSGAAARLEVDTLGQGRFANDWSFDNRFLLYIGGGRAIAKSDLWLAPLASPRDARPLLDSPFVETHGQISPTGNWLAYTSNETGRMEVYVDRFPGLGARRIVSSDGGGWPRWSHDGAELFYLSPDNVLMAVSIHATDERIDASGLRRLFEIRPRPPVRLDAYAYDVAPNGRFLVNALVEEPASAAITLVVNWNDRRN